ncbi:MAG: PKD domain-containing protein [Candidatus Bathyarchaeota archaeon]|jgi:PKD repeat protein
MDFLYNHRPLTIANYSWDFGDLSNLTTSDSVVTHIFDKTGTYNVTLTVTDIDGHTNSISQVIIVEKINSSISISAPEITPVMHSCVVNGSITPKRIGVNISIWLTPDNETWNPLTTVKTNGAGDYSYNWTPSEIGTHSLKANWTGDNDTLPSESPLITVNVKMPTFISISTSASSTFVGFRVNVTGTLYDLDGERLENEIVVLYYTFSGIQTWTPITSDTTDHSGNYFVMWIPPATGYFLLKAEWNGNSTQFGINNTTTLSSLPYQNQFIFTVESNSTISELSFDTEDWALSFEAEGPDGTMGYVRITVAKSLVNDIDDMRISIDDLELTDFSIVSIDDSWLLTFNYEHSVHSILVDLDINIIPEFQPLMLMLFFAMLLSYSLVIVHTLFTRTYVKQT